MADFMKQRIAAGVLLLAAVFLFCSMAASSKQTAGIRVKAPEAEDSGAQYYYESTVNPFYPELAPYYEVKGGYITGNCTWYAWGRACEIAGRKLPHVFWEMRVPGGKRTRKKAGILMEPARKEAQSPVMKHMWVLWSRRSLFLSRNPDGALKSRERLLFFTVESPGTANQKDIFIRRNNWLFKDFRGFFHDFTDGKMLRTVVFTGFAGYAVSRLPVFDQPVGIVRLDFRISLIEEPFVVKADGCRNIDFFGHGMQYLQDVQEY